MVTPQSTRSRGPEGREIAQLYRRIALILRAGFVGALTLILLGIIVALLRGQNVGDDVIALRDIPGALWRFEGQAIIDLGILTLLATPLAFVLAALATFARQRDWVFVGACVALVAILAGSVGLALL